MHTNKLGQPLIIVFATFLILLALSFLKPTIIFGYQLKPVELLSEITPTEVKADTLGVQDSTLIIKKDTVVRDLSDIIDYRSDSALLRFFTSLQKTGKSKHQTRIAYFGDSFIEGDLITQDLRALLQDKFGGGGVGYMPITSIVAGFRQSVSHTFGGWQTYSFANDLPKSHGLFISGFTFVPTYNDTIDSTAKHNGSWVTYSAVNKPRLNSFNKVRLFYGNSNANNYGTLNGINFPLNDSGIFNELTFRGPFSSVNANFNCNSKIDIFGMSLESDTGVIVDNFSFRGNSGLTMSKVARELYRASNEKLTYDLIVLEYGLNAISEKATEYKWYEKGFSTMLKFIKTCYPNTDILIVGLGDKALRVKGVYVEDPAVKQILALEQNVAFEERCAFWSLYDAMGGEGSMIAWADSIPALANKDYTHLNFRGARQVGTLFYEKLMKKYNEFNTQH